MPCLKCPNCGNETNRLIYLPVLRGDESRVCCDRCRSSMSHSSDKKLYTGKKLWSEEQVYTKDQIKEKNFEFERRTKQEVADNWKKMRKSTRMKLFGE